MAWLRTCTLRLALKNISPPVLRGQQRRWAQVHDVRFVATLPQTNKVFEKYRSKLDRKAKEIGVKDADELKKVYEERTKAAVTISPPQGSSSAFPPPLPAPSSETSTTATTTAASTSPSEAAAKSIAYPSIKTLSSYLDVPKVLSLPQKEIEYLWRLRHASSPNSLCATIPYPIYKNIEATARRHPQFILPLAREGQGAEIHFLQWTFPSPDTVTVLFTHLAEYKLRGEYSQPHTTVTHHLELAGPKGLVLLQGTVMENRGVSVEEGKWLLMCLQKFYGMESKPERVRLLRQFSDGDASFRVEDLVEEAEKVV